MASPNANLRTPLRETPESERNRRAQTKVTGEDSTPSKRGANGFNQHEFSGEDKENAGLYPIAKPMTPPDDNIDSAAIDQSSSSHKHATASTDNNNAVDGVVSNFQKNLAAAQKEMDDSRTVTREDIREQQQKEAEATSAQLQDLLHDFLPVYVFGTAPGMPKHKEKIQVPTILKQQTSKAISNAELNVYLSYIQSIEDKIEFLHKYSSIKINGTARSTDMMKQFRDQARLAEASPRVWEEDKTWLNKATNETFFIHRKDDPKFNVHEVLKKRPMAQEEIDRLEAEKKLLEEDKEHLQAELKELKDWIQKIPEGPATKSPAKSAEEQRLLRCP